jgi:uncharacterized protein YndB with AHSA1/START domain
LRQEKARFLKKVKQMPSFYQSSQSILIQAPPEKVYGALTDWALRAQWREGIQIRWEGSPRAFPGQQVEFGIQGPLWRTRIRFKVTGLEAPARLYLEYVGKPLEGRHAVEVTPEEDGSKVSFYWMKVRPVGWAARLYFALGFGMRAHRSRVTETLELLREYLENPR